MTLPESSIVVRPQPMDSATYTASSRLQAAGLQPAITLFAQAAREVPLPRAPHAVTIADYGAATGYNSLLPIGAAIEILRARTRLDHPILVVHTDVAENDFTALFTTLDDDPDSYLKAYPATFASAVGRSFYKQILPSDSIVLGWSSWAVMWLSRLPMPIPDHVQVAYSTDDAARRAFARQAAEDWHEFVAFRGRELAPGGRMVVLAMALDEAGDFGYRPAFAALLAGLHSMVEDGFLTAEEVRRMSIPVVARTEKDFRAPFAPSGRFEGLSIEHFELFDGADRFWHRYENDCDATAFGVSWADFLRASVFPTLAAALEAGTGDSRAAQFAERLHAATAARLAATPERMSIPLAKLVLAKRPRSA